MTRTVDLPIPSVEQATTVVPAPASGAGNWSGAPSAVLADDGTFWLAYRIRRPLKEGRGVAVVLARSTDGVAFTKVGEVGRESFRAASLERPALVHRPDGGWRLYVSCAAPDSKHWWIDALDADTVDRLPAATRVTVLPGDTHIAVKDPVVTVDASDWHMWVCCHPLDEPGQEDRMTSRYAHSPDGLSWALRDEVLVPRPGGWDRRGTRITAVFHRPVPAVLYDGRASAKENFAERTGVAIGDGRGRYLPACGAPVAWSPHASGALRYVSAVPLPDGGHRLFFEAARPDGAHDLFTQVVPPRDPPITPRP